jgi:hypothetical protein
MDGFAHQEFTGVLPVHVKEVGPLGVPEVSVTPGQGHCRRPIHSTFSRCDIGVRRMSGVEMSWSRCCREVRSLIILWILVGDEVLEGMYAQGRTTIEESRIGGRSGRAGGQGLAAETRSGPAGIVSKDPRVVPT